MYRTWQVQKTYYIFCRVFAHFVVPGGRQSDVSPRRASSSLSWRLAALLGQRERRTNDNLGRSLSDQRSTWRRRLWSILIFDEYHCNSLDAIYRNLFLLFSTFFFVHLSKLAKTGPAGSDYSRTGRAANFLVAKNAPWRKSGGGAPGISLSLCGQGEGAMWSNAITA